MPTTAEHYPTVLVADDDELARFALRVALEFDGCTVWEAATGSEAACVALERTVDAIVLDANMPGWSLEQTLEALQASSITARVAVIVVSGAPVELGQHAGFVLTVLRKPVRLESLRTVIRAVAEHHIVVRPEPIW